jgi:hypothetical protein
MKKAELQRIVGIDWSGRIDAAGQRRHIWSGVWTRQPTGRTTLRLESGRTRDEIAAWLISLAAETPQMVVGIDCCFSYPAWFLAEHGCSTVFDLWRHVASGHGERWLASGTAERDERFWGKPHKRPAQFSGVGLRSMYRHTDFDNKIAQALEGGDAGRALKMRGITPKSPFQIGGSGSVGTGSLRAMPVLLRLHDAGFRVWPFEAASASRPLLVEIYTRLMTGPVAKSNPTARQAYLAARRRSDALYKALPRGVLQKALGSEDAFDALVTTLEMAHHAAGFATLRPTRSAALRLEGITWRPGVTPAG